MLGEFTPWGLLGAAHCVIRRPQPATSVCMIEAVTVYVIQAVAVCIIETVTVCDRGSVTVRDRGCNRM